MSQLQKKSDPLMDYPYHLPDKPVPTGSYITYEEFFDWADEDTLAEWVDGRIEMSSPASYPHQEIAGLLYEVFRNYVRMLDLGLVLHNPFQMKLPGKQGSGREPDLIFLAKAHLSRREKGLIRGPADLAVEIISPESEWRDRHTKFREYAAGGVPEYWLIDPELQTAEFYRLDEQGHYQGQPLDAEGRYYSLVIPGLWIDPSWFWMEDMLDPHDILKEVAGEPYLNYLNKPRRPRK